MGDGLVRKCVIGEDFKRNDESVYAKICEILNIILTLIQIPNWEFWKTWEQCWTRKKWKPTEFLKSFRKKSAKNAKSTKNSNISKPVFEQLT
jgi:hypothetical protein